MIKRTGKHKLIIPKESNPRMLADGVIYADEYVEKFLDERSLKQVENVATLPGIVGNSMAMPDIHAGYGFPIGGVAAFDPGEGVISPGGVGYDINCGVRLIKTDLAEAEIKGKTEKILNVLFSSVPLGAGSEGNIRLSRNEEEEIALKGARWAVEKGFGEKVDLDRTESGGLMEGADPGCISRKAYERGRRQEGTLGSGNHFLEVQCVDEIFDEQAARIFGLFKGLVTLMVHTGSRGFGHQVCTDFVREMSAARSRYPFYLADRQLAAVPFKSPEGQRYFSAMKGAANYAWANRQILGHLAAGALSRALGRRVNSEMVYDVAHNIAKLEEHLIDGKIRKALVHRKGATRAFAPGSRELPPVYRNIGQPVIIPGDMGRFSYLFLGTQKAMEETFGSTCHGAGRLMSRSEARKKADYGEIVGRLKSGGVLIKAGSRATVLEEMSAAYKDVSNVVDVVHGAGISKKVARLRPVAVIKG